MLSKWFGLSLVFLAAAGNVSRAQPEDATIARVLEGLTSDNPLAQSSAREQLREMGPRAAAAAPRVAKLLDAQNPTTRAVAAFALGDIGPSAKECVPRLIKALRDENKTVRYAAASALGDIGKPAESATRFLVTALDDKSIRLAAAVALFQISENEVAIPALIDTLESESPSKRAIAAMFLGKYGPRAKQAELALGKLLRDKEAQVRIRAAEALWRVGRNKEALPALTKEIRNREPIAWYSAAEAVWRINRDPAVIKLLVNSLKSKDWIDRSMAARTLGWIGPDASRALPALRALANDEEETVRDAASRAVDAISPPCAYRNLIR